jgi:FkbM family methyltransferase
MIIQYLKLMFRVWKYRVMEDPGEIRYLLRMIRKGTMVLDIGAHKGGYTYWMKKAVGSKGKVFAFEPQPTGAELLRKLFHPTNVAVEAMALSDQNGEQELFIMPQAFDVSFEASLENKYEYAVKIRTETTTLDAYCRENNIKPAFIKIDVEGHEMQVINGGRLTLMDHHPALLIEVEERHIGREKMNSIFSFLQDIGYKGFFFKKGRKTPIADFDVALHQSPELLKNNRKQYINNFVFEFVSEE